MGGVGVACLLDTGSMVTTITQRFFEQLLQPSLKLQLQPCTWLKLKAANGLEIPYLGYLELDVHLFNRTFQKMGILVVKDSIDPNTQTYKQTVPGLLGMNVIRHCYQELFIDHGSSLFQSSVVRQAGKVWRRALSECQHLERVLESGRVGSVRVQAGPAVCIPAGSMKLVPASCHQGLGPTLSSALLEPTAFTDGNLSANLLIPTAYLSVTCGNVNVPVVNLGDQDLWLWPKLRLGELHVTTPPTSNLPVHFEMVGGCDEQVVLFNLPRQRTVLLLISPSSLGPLYQPKNNKKFIFYWKGTEVHLVRVKETWDAQTSFNTPSPCLIQPQCDNGTVDFHHPSMILSRSMYRSCWLITSLGPVVALMHHQSW